MQKQFGDRLKELRLEKKMTQEQLAKIFNTGKATISHYEGNRRLPDVNTIFQYAEFFGVTLEYIMGKDARKIIHEVEFSEISLDDRRIKEDMRIFSERLKDLMFKKDLTAELVSQKLQMEKSEFVNYAIGVSVPTPETVKKIALILETTVDYLFGLVDNPNPKDESKKFDNDILLPDYVDVAKSAQDKKIPAKVLSDFIKLFINREKDK